ncbi:hypothetical protein LMIY3S_03722 [Labrys miyagiensis]
MIVARVVNGVWTHFRLRLPEWVSATIMLGFGAILLEPGNTFELSPGFAFMADVAPENVWGVCLVLLGGLRFVALVLNGTFVPFQRLSPLVRSATATLAATAWMIVGIGILVSNNLLPGWLVYIGLSVLDAITGYSVAGEAGAAFRAHRNERPRS